jgi:hypothetical protein
MLNIRDKLIAIDKHRFRFIVIVFLALLLNSVIADLVLGRGIDVRYFLDVFIINMLFGILFPLLKKWVVFSNRFRIYELDEHFSVIMAVVLLGLLPVVSIVIWFYEEPFDRICFAFPWFVVYYAYSFKIMRNNK